MERSVSSDADQPLDSASTTSTTSTHSRSWKSFFQQHRRKIIIAATVCVLAVVLIAVVASVAGKKSSTGALSPLSNGVGGSTGSGGTGGDTGDTTDPGTGTGGTNTTNPGTGTGGTNTTDPGTGTGGTGGTTNTTDPGTGTGGTGTGPTTPGITTQAVQVAAASDGSKFEVVADFTISNPTDSNAVAVTAPFDITIFVGGVSVGVVTVPAMSYEIAGSAHATLHVQIPISIPADSVLQALLAQSLLQSTVSASVAGEFDINVTLPANGGETIASAHASFSSSLSVTGVAGFESTFSLTGAEVTSVSATSMAVSVQLTIFNPSPITWSLGDVGIDWTLDDDAGTAVGKSLLGSLSLHEGGNAFTTTFTLQPANEAAFAAFLASYFAGNAVRMLGYPHSSSNSLVIQQAFEQLTVSFRLPAPSPASETVVPTTIRPSTIRMASSNDAGSEADPVPTHFTANVSAIDILTFSEDGIHLRMTVDVYNPTAIGGALGSVGVRAYVLNQRLTDHNMAPADLSSYGISESELLYLGDITLQDVVLNAQGWTTFVATPVFAPSIDNPEKKKAISMMASLYLAGLPITFVLRCNPNGDLLSRLMCEAGFSMLTVLPGSVHDTLLPTIDVHALAFNFRSQQHPWATSLHVNVTVRNPLPFPFALSYLGFSLMLRSRGAFAAPWKENTEFPIVSLYKDLLGDAQTPSFILQPGQSHSFETHFQRHSAELSERLWAEMCVRKNLASVFFDSALVEIALPDLGIWAELEMDPKLTHLVVHDLDCRKSPVQRDTPMTDAEYLDLLCEKEVCGPDHLDIHHGLHIQRPGFPHREDILADLDDVDVERDFDVIRIRRHHRGFTGNHP